MCVPTTCGALEISANGKTAKLAQMGKIVFVGASSADGTAVTLGNATPTTELI